MNKKNSEKQSNSLSQIAPIVSEIVSQIVEKIRDEPFLFVIAIATLLVGLGLLSINLGLPNTRFIIAMIAILAFIVISGHFIIDVIRMREKRKRDIINMQLPGYIELWKCTICGYMNRWENWVCNDCKHGWKEDEDLHMWLCKKCDEYNVWENDFCSKCGKHYMMSPYIYKS